MVSGRARVYSHCVVRQGGVPGFALPYSVISVELEEQAGLYLFSSIDLVDDRPPEIGSPVTVVFEPHAWGALPTFVRSGLAS